MKIKRFYCTIEDCNKSFRSEDKLQDHIVSHSVKEETEEEKNLFECDMCNFKFPTKRSVSAHRRVHKSELNRQISNKVIRMLSARLSNFTLTEYTIEESPFFQQDLNLPSIGVPQEPYLPLFSQIVKILN